MYKNGKPVYNEIIFSEEQLEDIKKSYLNGESSVKLGKRYGCDHHTILKALHKMDVKVDRRLSTRKYAIDENYFDEIDTPNKAYILGFFYADGCNCMSKQTVTMALQKGDREILEDIRKEIKSEKPLEYLDYSNKHDFGYHYQNQYRLNMHCKHMCESLKRLGMVPNKSLVLEFPDIPEELYSHFIRGYFDGDGSINKKTGSFSITSTESFVSKVKRILEKELGVSHGIMCESGCKNGITYDLKFHRKEESSLIFDWIYKDAEMYLKRKYDIYLKIHCRKVA